MELATIATVLQAAGAVVGVVGSIASGNAAKAQGKAQQATYNREAKRKEEAALFASAQGDRKVAEQARERDVMLSNLQAGFAASGFDAAGSGDFDYLNRTIAARSDFQGRLDAWDAAMQARSYQIGANEDRVSGAVAKGRGDVDARNSYFGAVGAGAAGLGGFAEKFGSKPAQAPPQTGRYPKQNAKAYG